MKLVSKQDLKNILGQIPLTAEAYWYIRQPGKPITPEFTLDKLERSILDWRSQILGSEIYQSLRKETLSSRGKRIFIFATLRYWLEHATLLGMTLAGMGNEVTLGYLPYARWQEPIDAFSLRRQNLYTESVLGKADPLIHVLSLLAKTNGRKLPTDILKAVDLVSLRDTQYTLQVEDINPTCDLYKMRHQRNLSAAYAAYAYLSKHKPDVVILPNGTILEFGVIYKVTRFLGIPTVTYEFGEQRDRIWLAQDGEVMRQETNELWWTRQDQPLTSDQLDQVRRLFNARQRASLWENFARRWQGVPSEGGAQVRKSLGLDGRPIVLLATNVIGDSLTLGRQVFSDSMTEWLERTVQYFATRPDVQLVARIHPGELITKGPSVADVVQRALPSIPEHIHLVHADAKVNTYDIVEIADLGLVYTTTVGMEMAMSGVPVIVVGNTHYRAKGFTLDPESWEAYFELLNSIFSGKDPSRLTQSQVQLAWNYAYRFFFEYPQPFPWHLVHFWKDLETWPVARLLSDEGLSAYRKTFQYLAGEPIQW
ncbi:MAG TPA: hypothetical protein VLD65_09550 [Anaerolineales bacterium]|nr:hypothetical protein [Anaerolineales bacterium]